MFVLKKSVIKKLRQSVLQNRSSSLMKNQSNEEIDGNNGNLNILQNMHLQKMTKSEMVIGGVSNGRKSSVFKQNFENMMDIKK